ncbi:peptidase C60 family protein [Gracilibacillus halophilus YIM-C55.5]|uniref:Peptidase C60 family protein n=1 Tax=Gracilibacillus halophilus YIM-C55.5 TaxID=1308866 RepID=N4WGJ5_9BACI|nr:class D sortase [Gracilibacillus halophilus]ENH98379.1 peptidase C60 family protein [Gracilibacillus halophilus YIM-C55.5]
MKKLAFLFIMIGIVLLSIGGYQYFNIQAAEQQAANEANKRLEDSKNQTKDSSSHQRTIENFSPNTGDAVGFLHIPAIEAELPIIEGTDPEELEKGVGHYDTSAYPTENDQIVMSGHRDTVFRSLGEVEVGDTFMVELPYGNFEYEMVDSKIVDADDTSIIQSTAPKEELVITTCYPFSYIGNAPERYIIYAKPIYE